MDVYVELREQTGGLSAHYATKHSQHHGAYTATCNLTLDSTLTIAMSVAGDSQAERSLIAMLGPTRG